MRASEFIIEGLGRWINDKLGRGSWSKPGDVVSGRTVSNYLDSIGIGGLGPELERHDYVLKDIDPSTARKYRKITDKELKMSAIDQMSLASVKNVSYESLLQKPPVLLASGEIIDGNHRMEHAIKAKLPRIPILVQVKK
jgi:hypothetical protein